jgi:hypothetical protein
MAPCPLELQNPKSLREVPKYRDLMIAQDLKNPRAVCKGFIFGLWLCLKP